MLTSLPLEKLGIESVHLVHETFKTEMANHEFPSTLPHLPRHIRLSQKFQQCGRERRRIFPAARSIP